jgi:GTP cyclohydrolase I
MTIDHQKAAEAIRAFLRALGQDPDRNPDLANTAESVVKAWTEDLVDGYAVDVPAMLAAERIPAPPGSPGLVAIRDLRVSTMCPHHLLPAQGRASVFYLPGASILGLGAIARLLDAWAHRLSLQETIGQRVASSLVTDLGARAAACQMSLAHTCLSARGERQEEAIVETLSLAGSFSLPGPDRDLLLSLLGERR